MNINQPNPYPSGDREDQLYEQIAGYMTWKHPGVPYHFDLSGMWTPSHKARNLYGRLNKRAWPDLFIAWNIEPGLMDIENGMGNFYGGLFLELKRDGTRLKKQDGSWASDHIAEQADMLERLQDQGYIAQFACGFDEAVQIIDSYLGGDATNNKEMSDGLTF